MDISTLNHLICLEKHTLEVFALQFCEQPQEVEILVQDTIIAALQNNSGYQQGHNLKPWLYQLMKQIYLDANPAPLISIKPFEDTTASIQDGGSTFHLEENHDPIKKQDVNKALRQLINKYAKDLRTFEKKQTQLL